MNLRLKITFFWLFLLSSISIYGMERSPGSFSMERSLETLCTQCSVNAIREIPQYKSKFQSEFINDSHLRDFMVVLQNNQSLNYMENYVLNNILRSLEITKFGSSLVNNISTSHRLKIFYHLSSNLNLENAPLWEQERSNPHDLFGFFAANTESSVIALNLYQHPEVAVTTYLHELFHLYDPYIHKLAKQKVVSNTQKFLGEYRAYLAELKYYIEKLEANKKLFARPVENYSFHKKFVKRGKIKYEKLYKYLLNTHYPTNSSSKWVVDNSKSLELVVTNNNSVVERVFVEINSSKIHDSMYEILKKYLPKDKRSPFKILGKLRYKKVSTSVSNEKNRSIKKEIKKTIGKDIYKYLKSLDLLDVSHFTRFPLEGESFGPKERGKGD